MKRPPPRTLCGGQVLAALGVALFLGGGFPDCTHTGQSPDLPAEPPLDYDVIVAGATLGGTAAAIQSVRGGARTLLIASSSWIGGQATEEGVPFDLPYLSDPIGCLESGAPCRYMERRTFGWLEELTADVRRIYAERFGVTTENPGECWLTDCVEPRIVHEAIRLEIASLTATGNLDVLLSTEIADSGRRRDGARWVLLRAPGASAPSPAACSSKRRRVGTSSRSSASLSRSAASFNPAPVSRMP